MKLIAKVAFEVPTTQKVIEALFGKRTAIAIPTHNDASDIMNTTNADSHTEEANADVDVDVDTDVDLPKKCDNEDDMKDAIREMLSVVEDEGTKQAEVKVKTWLKDKIGLEDSINSIREYKTMHEECHAVRLHFEATQDSFRKDCINAARELMTENFNATNVMIGNSSRTLDENETAFDYDLESCQRSTMDSTHSSSSSSSSSLSSVSLQTPKNHLRTYFNDPMSTWSAGKKRTVTFTPPIKRSKPNVD